MNVYYLTRDSSGKLNVCGTDDAAVEFAQSQGQEIIGTIDTDLDILEAKQYICAK